MTEEKRYNLIRIEPDGSTWKLGKNLTKNELNREMMIQDFYSNLLPKNTRHEIEEIKKSD